MHLAHTPAILFKRIWKIVEKTLKRLKFFRYLVTHRPLGIRANIELFVIVPSTMLWRPTATVSIDEYVVLNLDRSRERLAHMHRLFKKHQLPEFQRFSATDGALWSDGELEKFVRDGVIRKTFHGSPSPGSVANWLSHVKILEYVAKSWSRWVFVLEDDVEFVNVRHPEQLRRFELPKDGELVFVNETAKGIGPVIGKNVRRAFIGYRTTGYLVSRDGADRILQSPFSKTYHTTVDTMLWWLNRIRPRTDYFLSPESQYSETNLRMYCLTEPVVRHSGRFESTKTGDR